MNSKFALLEKAAAHRDERRYDRARDTFFNILEQFGEDPDVMWGLAESEYSLSITSPDAEDSRGYEAIRWIEKAIDIDPDRPEFHFFLGTIREHVGAPNYEAAAKAYRRALEVNPMFEPAIGALAMLHGVPERPVTLEDAIAFAEKSAGISPSRSMWITLSRLYEEAGHPKKARAALKNSLLERHDASPILY